MHSKTGKMQLRNGVVCCSEFVDSSSNGKQARIPLLVLWLEHEASDFIRVHSSLNEADQRDPVPDIHPSVFMNTWTKQGGPFWTHCVSNFFSAHRNQWGNRKWMPGTTECCWANGTRCWMKSVRLSAVITTHVVEVTSDINATLTCVPALAYEIPISSSFIC